MSNEIDKEAASLRDWFAVNCPVMQFYKDPMLPYNIGRQLELEAMYRYKWADAMLKAREVKNAE